MAANIESLRYLSTALGCGAPQQQLREREALAAETLADRREFGEVPVVVEAHVDPAVKHHSLAADCDQHAASPHVLAAPEAHYVYARRWPVGRALWAGRRLCSVSQRLGCVRVSTVTQQLAPLRFILVHGLHAGVSGRFSPKVSQQGNCVAGQRISYYEYTAAS